ncbi:nucleotidyltransferase domain-containing protein [Uruburuella testudinis]
MLLCKGNSTCANDVGNKFLYARLHCDSVSCMINQGQSIIRYTSSKYANIIKTFGYVINDFSPVVGSGAIFKEASHIPQGITYKQILSMSSKLKSRLGEISDDILVQGSRAAGTAKITSDIDIAVRVSPTQFQKLVKEYFGSPNVGSAKERTMLHAIKTGKIQSGEARLSPLRKELERDLNMPVDISIIQKGGAFDKPPYIDIK